jgi:beta-lactamase regulating signal transducer with metallopeptidase domain
MLLSFATGTFILRKYFKTRIRTNLAFKIWTLVAILAILLLVFLHFSVQYNEKVLIHRFVTNQVIPASALNGNQNMNLKGENS